MKKKKNVNGIREAGLPVPLAVAQTMATLNSCGLAFNGK